MDMDAYLKIRLFRIDQWLVYQVLEQKYRTHDFAQKCYFIKDLKVDILSYGCPEIDIFNIANSKVINLYVRGADLSEDNRLYLCNCDTIEQALDIEFAINQACKEYNIDMSELESNTEKATK